MVTSGTDSPVATRRTLIRITTLIGQIFFTIQPLATDAGFTVRDNCGADNDHDTLAAAVADAIECIEETDTDGDLAEWVTALRAVEL